MQPQTQQVTDQMVTMLHADAALMEAVKADPATELPKLADAAEKNLPAYASDRLLYRGAIAVLSLLALIAALGSIVLVLDGKTTPEVLVALGSAAVGALVGLFATPPTTK